MRKPDAISVPIDSEAWVNEKNSYMNLPAEHKNFFPDDCFIARGTGKENKDLLADRGIDLHYQGSEAPVRCFMELRDTGKFRPSSRGDIKKFFAHTGARSGDSIEFERMAPRAYRVTLIKR